MNTSVTPRASGPRFKFALMMLAGSLGVAMAAGAASAATVDTDQTSLVVKYTAQSLDTDAGVQQLYRRILGAARQVCPDEDIRDLGASARVQACRTKAVAHAIQHIDNTRLAALYAASSKSG
jgi:UrcA family protein